MFKKFCLWTTTNLFLISLLFIVTLGAVSTLVTPKYIKSWAEKSGAYSSLADIALKEASKEQAKQKEEDGLSFNDPLVKQAAKDTLSANFYREATTEFIDGSFSWLQNKTPDPTFNIDVAEVKTSFINRLGDLAKERYEALPICGNNTAPKSLDLLKINCRPIDYDIDQAIIAQKTSLLSDPSFLAESSLTADSIGKVEGKSFFQRHSEIPTAYVWLQRIPMIFSILAALTAVAVIFLAETKKKGVRKLGWRATSAGLFGLILAGLSTVGISKARDLALSQKDGATVNGYKDIVAAAMNAIRTDTALVSGLIALAVLVIGILILLATRNRKSNSNKAKLEEDTIDLDDKKTEDQEEDEDKYVADLDNKEPEDSGQQSSDTPKKIALAPSNRPTTKTPSTAPAVTPKLKTQPKRPTNLIQ